MAQNNEGAGYGGVGFFGLLAILFIGLKLTGYIDWSWWYVLLPLWGPFALFSVGLIIVGLFCFIFLLVSVLIDYMRS